nr:MAG TPA: hypothetical protein [Caudoviricetes sp.]
MIPFRVEFIPPILPATDALCFPVNPSFPSLLLANPPVVPFEPPL